MYIIYIEYYSEKKKIIISGKYSIRYKKLGKRAIFGYAVEKS